MLKLLGGVVVGVFVGAMVFEILHRRNPNLLRGIEEKARRTARAAADAPTRSTRGTTGASAPARPPPTNDSVDEPASSAAR